LRILLDTNIFIYREDNHAIRDDLQEMLRRIGEKGDTLLYHPASKEDIQHDRDEKRKTVILSKISSYMELNSPPKVENDVRFLGIIGEDAYRRDPLDVSILYSVSRNCVDFLITEDSGLRSLARKVNLEGRVLSIRDFLELFPKREELRQTTALSVVHEHAYNLDLEDPIFDDLKHNYDEFEEWWAEKVCKKDRMAWISRLPDGRLGSILMYKDEDNETLTGIPDSPRKKRVKITTLKVVDVGQKLGDMLLDLAIKYAFKNEVDEIYVTHFTEENDHLVPRLLEFGFKLYGTNDRGEEVYVKPMIISTDDLVGLSPVEISKRLYPHFFDGGLVGKFIVPIKPIYHERLFTDQPRQAQIGEFSGEFIVEGNAVRKAYLCRSQIRRISPGDILVFYRSGDWHGVRTIGVVDEIYYEQNDIDTIYALVKRRTVYSKEEIREMLASGPLTIVLFRYHGYLHRIVGLPELISNNVLRGQPQAISTLSEEEYSKILEVGGFDRRLIIH
jgi:hypothetical protein